MHSTTPGTFLQSNKSLAASNKSSFKPTELTANSGYMADDNNSQARTPGKYGCICLTHSTYMTNSTLVSPVKMEYGWNSSIFGLKMMMKSSLEKIFLKFFHALWEIINVFFTSYIEGFLQKLQIQ